MKVDDLHNTYDESSAFVNWKVRRKSAAIVCGGKTRRTHNVTTRLVSPYVMPAFSDILL